MNATKINSAAAERLLSADVAKAIAIFLVVLGHHKFVYESHTNVQIMILSFHMPAFYFISGLFFNPNSNLIDVIKKRLHSLIKPYFVVGLLFCLLLFIKSMNSSILFTSIKSLAYGNGAYLSWPMNALWFLPSLFVTSIGYFIIYSMVLTKIKKRLRRIGFLLAIMFIGGIAVNLQKHVMLWNGLPWNLDLVLVTMFFYGIGFEVREYINNIGIGWLFISIVIFFIMHIEFTLVVTPTVFNLNSRIYDNCGVILVESMSGIAIVYALSIVICRKYRKLADMCAYIGKRSLSIFVFHSLILPYICILVIRATRIDNVATCIIGVLITIIVCLILHELFVGVPILRYWILNQGKKIEIFNVT